MILTLYRYKNNQLFWYADVAVESRDEALKILMSLDVSECAWEIREGSIEG